MRRREVVLAGLSLPLTALARELETLSSSASGGAFDDGTVPAQARALAGAAWRAPDRRLPAALEKVGYDGYRDFRYRPARALWRDRGLPFQAQFFHRGFLFQERVDMFVVDAGKATPVAFSTALFDYAPRPALRDADVGDLGFAGFRLHAPINRADYFDEVCAFLGASYFRAVAKGLHYGLSARGLALGTGEPGPEEFPVFKAFWLERPAAGAEAMVVHALLDGPSAAAALRFRIVPGEETVFDVDMRLYPRVTLVKPGIAPLTSMFDFDASDRLGVDDYRPAVHDSDGLALLNGNGEQAWRQLQNPKTLQHSGFQDRNPRGFGLMQRKRDYADYMDAEANYQNRPGLWVEPVGDWGEGEVHLVEIPTANEYSDNIVAFWRPREPLAAGREHRWRYRLHWCRDHAWQPQLARVAATRVGRAAKAGARLFVIDLAGGRLSQLPADAEPQIEATSPQGAVRNAVAYRHQRGWRLSFELQPGEARAAELRARLFDGKGPLSETWLYRWLA
ncbi:glucan biosynthesis protein [Luteimonas aquatica]|uniref:glucan biosynthesis protein n=1 Tax=Luteimonas aquatica TaxID=450364 RepID=UPI001F596FF0|nr:glucan biosynthesis protein G [Luteimonas aquatica]